MASDSPNTDSDAPPPPKGKSKLVLVLVLVNLVAVGGLGAYLVLGHGGQAAHAAAPPAHPAESVGPIIPLDPPIITNLGDTDQVRYLKVAVQLEVAREEVKPDVERALVPIRDRMLVHFSSLQANATQGAANKRRIQQDLLRMVNEIVGGRVKHVYFTEFVVQ